MRLRIALLAVFSCLPALAQTSSTPPTAPLQNWGIPTYIDDFPLPGNSSYSPALTNYQSHIQNGLVSPLTGGSTCQQGPEINGLVFTFTIAASDTQDTIPATGMHQHTVATQGAISTSAVIYDATALPSTLVATLWNSVTLANGTYCGIWNGYPDTGATAVPVTSSASPFYGHNFQVKVMYNNVQYTWDGMVGDSSSAMAGYNWDSTSSFPSGMSFLNYPGSGTSEYGVVADGYSENSIDASIFVSKSTAEPTGNPDVLWPLNLSLAGANEFQFTTTDGATVYFAATTGSSGYYNAVVGFRLTNTDPTFVGTSSPSVATNTSACSETTYSDPNNCETFTSSSIAASNGPGPWGTPYLFTSVDTDCEFGWGLCIPSVPAIEFFENSPLDVQLSNSASSTTQSSFPSADTTIKFDNGVAQSQTLCQVVEGTSGSCTSNPVTPPTIAAPQIPITGIAVQNSSAGFGNLLAVSEGLFDPLGCNDLNQIYNIQHGVMNTLAYSSIALYDKSTGAALGGNEPGFPGGFNLGNDPVTSLPINAQKMAFDLAGNLWLIDGGTPGVDCTNPASPLLGNRSEAGMDPIWLTYGHLLKVTFGGSSGNPTIASVTAPISGLSNPVDIAVSPNTGNIYVADGGTNQQVFEYSPSNLGSPIQTIGAQGGYGVGWVNGIQNSTPSSCNANISSNKLWLDYYARGSGISRPWIAVDNENRLWVGDSSTSRVLIFSLQGGNYAQTGGASMNSFLYNLAVPQNAPSRVFSGTNGMLEYSVQYETGSAPKNTLLTGNNAFSSVPVNNWLPCFLQQEWVSGGYTDTSAVLTSAEEFEGNAFGFVTYHSENATLNGRNETPQKNAVIAIPGTGVLTLENNPSTVVPNPFSVWFDRNGAYYETVGGGSSCGSTETPTGSYALCQYPVTGSSSDFPTWSAGKVLATITPSLTAGLPIPGRPSDGFDFSPTTNSVVPFYGGPGWDDHNPDDPNLAPAICEPTNTACSPYTGPTYHLAGVADGNAAFNWHAQLESDVEYPTLTFDPDPNSLEYSTSPANNVNNLGIYSTSAGVNSNSTSNPPTAAFNMGFEAHSIDNFIFTGVNGNWHQFSCQFYHHTDDGMLVGQFGWRGTGVYQPAGSSSGFPVYMKAEGAAPGECSNPNEFKLVKVLNSMPQGSAYPSQYEYYLYVTDEGYRKGVQRWHIWNASSIYCDTNTAPAAPGTSVTLSPPTQGECQADN